MSTFNTNTTTVLAYGKSHLTLHLPAGVEATILEKQKATNRPENTPSEATLISQALAHPIGGEGCTIASASVNQKTACILICDITRPVPNSLFLRPIVNQLLGGGIHLEAITILIATGLHRSNLNDELVELISDKWILEHVNIVNNDARDDNAFVDLGFTSSQVPVKLNRLFVNADVKIATGLVEPHFMAGFSGGRKVISPGVAHHTTIRTFHSARFMEDVHATSCNLVSNPLHEAQLEIVDMVKARDNGHDILALNTVLDAERKLVAATFGEIIASHLAAVQYVRSSAELAVSRRFGTVVTSAGGYPLDKTYYQTVKGMVTPLDVLSPGGTLIICSECSEGMGSHEFVKAQESLLNLGPTAFLKTLTNKSLADIDEWQTEELLKSINVGRVVLFAPTLDSDAATGVERTNDLDSAVRDAVERWRMQGGEEGMAVIPEGPYVVPFYRTKT